MMEMMVVAMTAIPASDKVAARTHRNDATTRADRNCATAGTDRYRATADCRRSTQAGSARWCASKTATHGAAPTGPARWCGTTHSAAHSTAATAAEAPRTAATPNCSASAATPNRCAASSANGSASLSDCNLRRKHDKGRGRQERHYCFAHIDLPSKKLTPQRQAIPASP
jgi:hypothetical protein